MPALPELQRRFAAAMLDPDQQTVRHSLRAEGLGREQRLQIYRNNIFTSLTEALRATHPVVEKLVGEGFFRYACHQFILRHPSTSGDLEDFGEKFSAFLAAFGPAAELPYLPDVARLEWLYHEAYHAQECGPLDVGRLSAVPPADHERIRFLLHPAALLMQSPYPVLRIWQANQGDVEGDGTISPDSGAVRLLIRRRDDVEFHALGVGEYEFLGVLNDGASLGAAAEAALSAQADFDLSSTLARFVTDGTLIDFHICD